MKHRKKVKITLELEVTASNDKCWDEQIRELSRGGFISFLNAHGGGPDGASGYEYVRISNARAFVNKYTKKRKPRR